VDANIGGIITNNKDKLIIEKAGFIIEKIVPVVFLTGTKNVFFERDLYLVE
jgi:hypothetical protein